MEGIGKVGQATRTKMHATKMRGEDMRNNETGNNQQTLEGDYKR